MKLTIKTFYYCHCIGIYDLTKIVKCNFCHNLAALQDNYGGTLCDITLLNAFKLPV